jgi:hypothetical protein
MTNKQVESCSSKRAKKGGGKEGTFGKSYNQGRQENI